MRVIAIENQQTVLFKSKIRRTNTLGFGINRAIELGDKGFFNAIKHLANDGFKREIVVSGTNTTTKKIASATTILRTDNLEYNVRSSQSRKNGVDGFQLTAENVIELIKKLAEETGNISK